jgi:ribosomal protein S18 acetylase RimI-like enzyme
MTQIRAMTEQDVPSVSLLIGESWRRTYSPIMGAETAALISDEDHTLQRIAAELTDTNKMSFVAERPDGSIAGYAMAKMNEAGDVMLDRLHIDQSEYGTGLAANILHAVFAAHSGIPSIALEVLEGNDRAMAFYRKHGSQGRVARCRRPCIVDYAQTAISRLVGTRASNSTRLPSPAHRRPPRSQSK